MNPNGTTLKKSNNKPSEIFIIDDNPENLHVLENILDKAGYNVRLAKNANQALKSLDLQHPDLILLDINMPDVNGIELCAMIKARKLLKDIPVIFISALSETFDKIRAFNAGGLDYIVKPFQIDEVLVRVKTHLSLRKKTLKLKNTLKKLKLTQSQLIQSEKMASIGILAAGLAHEINNPINFIQTGVDALKKDIQDLNQWLQFCKSNLENCNDKGLLNKYQQLNESLQLDVLEEEIPELIENLLVGTKRTAEIINSLLDFSRPDHSKKQEVNLNQDIDNTLVILQHEMKSFIQVDKNYANIPLLNCYAGKINQVFMNVISNAVKAVKEKKLASKELDFQGKIAIETREIKENETDYILICIKDNGIGIPEKIQSKIFDPFFSTRDVGKGLGLGLYITHNIIKQNQGKIELGNSSGEYQTCFNIYLPISIY